MPSLLEQIEKEAPDNGCKYCNKCRQCEHPIEYCPVNFPLIRDEAIEYWIEKGMTLAELVNTFWLSRNKIKRQWERGKWEKN